MKINPHGKVPALAIDDTILTENVAILTYLARRFPKAHKFVVWILLPVAYVTVSSLADNGTLQAVPVAILRLAIITPAFLQAFWIPSNAIDRLILAFSPNIAQENSHST